MSGALQGGTLTLDAPSALFAAALAEVDRARAKFPGTAHLALAFAEEAGEAVRAALQLHYACRHPTPTPRNIECAQADLRKELVQTVAMCLRLWEEGDTALGTPPAFGGRS